MFEISFAVFASKWLVILLFNNKVSRPDSQASEIMLIGQALHIPKWNTIRGRLFFLNKLTDTTDFNNFRIGLKYSRKPQICICNYWSFSTRIHSWFYCTIIQKDIGIIVLVLNWFKNERLLHLIILRLVGVTQFILDVFKHSK